METNTVFILNGLSQQTLGENAHTETFQKAQQGDQEAFSEIYNLFFDKIYTFIYFRVNHKEIAEDLAEDVFMKAFQRISKLKEPKAFEGWIYQIARNTVIDYYRSKKQVVALEEVENTIQYEHALVDVIELEAQQRIFLELLNELGAEQKAVIKMKFFEHLENETIATQLNKTEGAIRVIQHRALSRLKDLLKDKGITNAS
jgi:RNA polymerase sigma-70 factor (ECF subfamily)